MALVLYDRVQQTGTSNTTVSFTLSGSVTGYQSFSVVGNGNTTFYGATDTNGNWEVGVGTYSTTGPTLTRTTILSSSNAGSAVTFSGIVTVFVTYPAGKSVNLDSSGNVSPLGTIASGVWNGSTIPVAYGGTGVTASSGANSVMLRDANQNVAVNRLNQANTSIAAAGGTTALTAASTYSQTLTGTGNQTYTMPDATTLTTAVAFVFNNNATGTLTLQDYATGAIGTITSGGAVELVLLANGTVAGTWDVHGFLPENVTWGTNALNLGSTVITNGTWNGGTITPAYGGTGLTTFTAANNALYSTSSSALAAGTLPVLAGGTGVTTSTGSGNVVLSTSPTLVTPALGTPSSGNLANCTGYPGGSISGTVAIANGGTGQTTASAAFNALSPVTTTGDLIIGNGTNSSTRLAIGTNGKVLSSNGTTASWTTPDYGGGTVTTTDFTATAGQTVFTVSYTVGSTEVYQNGVKLGIADFTATNGTSITLATGATVGDLVEVVTFSVLNLYSTITSETFNGTGSQTIFTMSAVPANAASLLVAIAGVVQDPTTYTVVSNTLTFSTAPPSGTGNVSVRYLGIATTGSSFSAGTTGLTPSSATTGAVVLAGTLNVANGGTGVTTSTGSGANVLGTSPTLTTPTIDKINTSVANTSLGAGNASIMKNRIINGAMVIDQRNAGASVSPAATQYTLDRWQAIMNAASAKYSVQQNAGSVTLPTGFSNYLGVTSLGAYTVAAGEIMAIQQAIEGYNIADLGWGTANAKTVTLSFQVYSSLTGTFGGAIRQGSGARSYPFTYSIPVANTWTTISVTIAGDTSGTYATNNTAGLLISFGMGVGSTFSGTAGSWSGSNFVSATGATSVVGTNGATFYITGVQLEVGSSATGFEYRLYNQELLTCQRYAASTFPIGTAWGQNKGAPGCLLVGSTGVSGYGCQASWRFPVNMRSTPSTITTYNPVVANANARNFASTVDRTITALGFSQNGSTSITYSIDTTGDVVGMAYGVHYSVDAEL
jgi:hypothetical protein